VTGFVFYLTDAIESCTIYLPLVNKL
jgi:hypothetical protein